MDIIPNSMRGYKKTNICREQHGDNMFKCTRSGFMTNTPAFMLNTQADRINDISLIIVRIVKLHTTIFPARILGIVL